MTTWIIPNNPKDYDIHDGVIRYENEIEWTKNFQTKSIATGDTVYIYEAKPIMALTMKFVVIEKNVTTPDQRHRNDGMETGESWFKIRFLRDVEPTAYETLLNLGVVRGYIQAPRKLKSDQEHALSRYIETRDGDSKTSVIRKILSDQSITTDEIAEEIVTINDLGVIEQVLKALSTSLPPQRVERVVNKIVRNSNLAQLIKQTQKYICEICGREPFIQINDEPYAEADHIKPLGGEYNGLDTPENMRCLCAQCHAIITHGSEKVIRELLRPTKWQS